MTARQAVTLIEKDLRNRRGLRQAFESIDDDIQDEIREVWRTIIAAEIKAAVDKAIR